MNHPSHFRIMSTAFAVLLTVAGTTSADPGYLIRPCPVTAQPALNAKATLNLKQGATLEILGRKGGWMEVTAGKQKGWMRMSCLRKGTPPAAANTTTEAGGVLALASGRAGTGNVAASTGVRGLNEEELQSATYDAAQQERLESYGVSRQEAERFAKDGKLVARKVEFLPAEAR